MPFNIELEIGKAFDKTPFVGDLFLPHVEYSYCKMSTRLWSDISYNDSDCYEYLKADARIALLPGYLLLCLCWYREELEWLSDEILTDITEPDMVDGPLRQQLWDLITSLNTKQLSVIAQCVGLLEDHLGSPEYFSMSGKHAYDRRQRFWNNYL